MENTQAAWICMCSEAAGRWICFSKKTPPGKKWGRGTCTDYWSFGLVEIWPFSASSSPFWLKVMLSGHPVGVGVGYHLTCSHIDIDWSVFSIYKNLKSALAKLQFPLLSSRGHSGPPQSSCIFIKKLIYFPTSSIESVPLIKLIQIWLPEFCPVKDTDY